MGIEDEGPEFWIAQNAAKEIHEKQKDFRNKYASEPQAIIIPTWLKGPFDEWLKAASKYLKDITEQDPNDFVLFGMHAFFSDGTQDIQVF